MNSLVGVLSLFLVSTYFDNGLYLSGRLNRRREHAARYFVSVICLAIIDFMLNELSTTERIFCINRSTHWRHIQLNMNDHIPDFRNNFRMNPDVFEALVLKLEVHLTHETTHLRETISARVRLAIFLYWAGHDCTYQTISNLFGVGKSTVSGIIKEVAGTIVQYMAYKIHFPDTLEQLSASSFAFQVNSPNGHGYGHRLD